MTHVSKSLRVQRLEAPGSRPPSARFVPDIRVYKVRNTDNIALVVLIS